MATTSGLLTGLVVIGVGLGVVRLRIHCDVGISDMDEVCANVG